MRTTKRFLVILAISLCVASIGIGTICLTENEKRPKPKHHMLIAVPQPNGLLHIRRVDNRHIPLSPDEELRIKQYITDKQLEVVQSLVDAQGKPIGMIARHK